MCSRVEQRRESDMDFASSPDWIPEWIGHLGMAAWVSDPNGRITYINARAQDLFECGDRVEGSACHSLVRGLDSAGKSFCGPDCEVACSARAGREIEPRIMRVGKGGPWILVFVIGLEAPDGSSPWLCHCASNIDRLGRVEQYLRRVASRSAPLAETLDSHSRLTPREREVLDLLAADAEANARAVAARLHVSYTTVRNHIQNILAKCGVHSIQEAVAMHLLGEGPDDESSPDGAK